MKRIVIPAALILIGLPLAASAFKEGPYPNVTGGFGEQSCDRPHHIGDLSSAEFDLRTLGTHWHPETRTAECLALSNHPHATPLAIFVR